MACLPLNCDRLLSCQLSGLVSDGEAYDADLPRFAAASSTVATQTQSSGPLAASPRLDVGVQPELCQQSVGVMIRLSTHAAWFRGAMQEM